MVTLKQNNQNEQIGGGFDLNFPKKNEHRELRDNNY